MISKTLAGFGFYEASIKMADVSGLNNAFWLTTEDKFEIDIAEIHFPNEVRFTLHNNNHWATVKQDINHAVGFDAKFRDNFAQSFHDFGVLWTENDIIFEVDGQPVAAIATNGSIHGQAEVRFSTAVMEYGGKIPDNPTGHQMSVRSLRVYSLQSGR
jgi:beta-glucanase (GH16 family)